MQMNTTLINRLTIGILIFAGVLLLWFLYPLKNNNAPQEVLAEDMREDAPETSICEKRRNIDGVCIETSADANPQLVAVMIENHLAANPLSGLAKASVVYEAPVEGNIPRFLALFSADTDVSKVGPVRSARPYYLDWLAEYPGAMYMHVGGSPAALDRIAREEVFDMNEFSRGWYYWRNEERSAPHNTYTSRTLWRSALDRYAETTSTPVEEWIFVDGEQCGAKAEAYDTCTKEVSITFLPGSYEVTWKYNTSTVQYERYQNGRAHTDNDGSAYVANTIVLQYVASEVTDAIGRLDIETVGEGKAVIITGGMAGEGIWKKEHRSARTRWYDETGNEIGLNPGKIWIEVISETMATIFIQSSS